MVTILAALAQMEREQVAARTRAALRELRRRGRRTSRFAPYGFDVDGEGALLVPNEEEQAHLSRMLRWRAEGWSYARITRELNGRGVPAKQGGRWCPATVRNMLRRVAAA